MRVVKRFHPEVVPGHEKTGRAGTKIANREGKHSVQPLDAIRTFFLVKPKHHFGVTFRNEGVPFRLQLLPQIAEVVDFPVVSDPQRALRIAHRHVAVGREIEDRKPPAAQGKVRAVGKALLPQAGVVRTAVRLDRGHPRQRLFISAIGQPADSAHKTASTLPAAQFVDLGFDMKKLHALKPAVDQSRHAIQKSQPEDISIDEQQKRRTGQRE